MSSDSQFGAFVHPLMAFTANGIPLGIAWHKNWARTEIETGMTPAEKKKQRNATPIEDKESIRWIEGLREALHVATECPNTRCIRIEEGQFEFLDREMNCIALYMILAWRVLLLCRLGRMCPDMNCEHVFEPSEWKAVYLVVTKKDLPKTPPGLDEMIRLIASLGGYVNRTKTEPGTQTLWIGLQRSQSGKAG